MSIWDIPVHRTSEIEEQLAARRVRRAQAQLMSVEVDNSFKATFSNYEWPDRTDKDLSIRSIIAITEGE